MANYYVRQTGNDASAGTSAGAAWRTVGKALATIAAGDTAYIGAGIYRETNVLTQSFGSDAFFVGDVDGSQTGDAGEVRITAATGGSHFQPVAATILIKVVGKNHYYWKNIVFVNIGNAAIIDATTTTAGGTNWTFDDCAFFSLTPAGAAACITFTAIIDTAHHWAFNRCRFWHSSSSCFTVNIPTTATAADYDIDFQLNNCVLIAVGNSTCMNTTGTGANSNKGGGTKVQNCTLIGTNLFKTTGGGLLSTTSPCTIYNSVCIGSGTAVSAATSGQIVEDFNHLWTALARTNVTTGVHSSAFASLVPEYLFSLGQESIWGGRYRSAFAPADNSALLGFGANVSSPAPLTTDLLGATRPAGTIKIFATGTLTSATATTATDSGASFGSWVGETIKITGGTGSGQTKTIKSLTGTAITVYGNWNTTPDNTSTYAVYSGAISESGKATSATATTLVQSTDSWIANMWIGCTVEITAGTNSGQNTTISASSSNQLTVPSWPGGTPDSTSTFVIYRQTSVNAILSAIGPLERGNTAQKETTLTDAGSVAWKLYGYAYQDVRIPVDNSSTTITVKCSFDTDHGNTNKPQASILADAEIGVTAETKTCTGSAGSGTFETLTFTAQTPSGKGWIVVRLQARSDNATGRAIFDTVTVT